MYWGLKGERREKERLVLYLCPKKTEFILFYYFCILAWEDVGKIFKACRCIYRHWGRFWRLWCTCNLHHTFLRAESCLSSSEPPALVCNLRTSFTRLLKMRPQTPWLEPHLGVPWLQEEQHPLPLCRLLVWAVINSALAADMHWTLFRVILHSHSNSDCRTVHTFISWHMLVTFIHYCWWEV